MRGAVLKAPSERERILGAMAASCAANGYAGASVDDVLRRTGLDRAAFERHFADKEDCALGAVDEMLAETTRAVTDAIEPDLADWQRLIRATHALLELLAARPSHARLAYVEARHAMPAAAYERYAAIIRVMAALLERARGYAAGGTPAIASRAAIGGAGLLIRRELIAGRADRLPELLPDIIYGTVVPFLPQREALRYADLARELINR
jgi:AcrR family transcriptional regulator